MKKSYILFGLVMLVLGIVVGSMLGQFYIKDAEKYHNPASASQAADASTTQVSSSSENQEVDSGESAPASSATTSQASDEEPTSSTAQDDVSLSSASSAQDDASLSSASSAQEEASPKVETVGVQVSEDGHYTSKEEVAAYIHEFGHLPSNYISKSKAKKQGWVSKKGNLDEVLPGMSIGGSEFYNDEGVLPDAPGRTWTECDINYEGGYRGAERIVFSNDGLIFYTGDHYKSFEQLY